VSLASRTRCWLRPPWRNPASCSSPISYRYNGALALVVPVLGLALVVPVLGRALGVLVHVPARGGLFHAPARLWVLSRALARGAPFRPEASAGIIQDLVFAYSQRRVGISALH
jgi:hypothetical protein